MTVTYSSNNSGGDWWLSDEDWIALEKAGWEIKWFKEDPYWKDRLGEGDRWLGALASSAIRKGLSEDDAISEWERITGQDALDGGCSCCGEPHDFYTKGPEDD